MIERLMSDARQVGPDAVTVTAAEWGGWYVAILGGRVSQIYDQQSEAQVKADEFISRIFG